MEATFSEVRPQKQAIWRMHLPHPEPKLRSVFELLEAVLLGVGQGLTEFLPVSSSGHLLLGQYFLGMDQDRFGLSFDAAIHTGTVLAVCGSFGRTSWRWRERS